MAPRLGIRRRRVVALAVVVLGAVVVVWTIAVALVAARDLRDARADIHRLTARQIPDRAALEAALAMDLRRVRHAQHLLGQPGPVVFGWLPILGRNVDGERAVADAAHAALSAGLTLSRSTRNLGAPGGGVDLARVESADRSLHAAAAQLFPPLHRLATQPVAWTLPQVSDGVRQARDQLLSLGPRLTRAMSGFDALHGVLGGGQRRTVAIILMNNAELRGAGGLPAAYATGSIEQGQFHLAPFADVNLLSKPPGEARRVSSPADFHSTYGPYLADTTLWKNTTMSPLDDETAQVVAAAAAASLRTRPDVVVLCDVPAAAAIASATGPITIDGESVTGDELTRRLLVDAYGNGSLSRARQRQRHRALDEAATQAFDRLSKNGSSTPALLEAVAAAVGGRHLVLWSARPEEE